MTQAVVGSSGSRVALALLLWAVGSFWPVSLEAQDPRGGAEGPRGGDRAGAAEAGEARAGGDSSGSPSPGPGGSSAGGGSSSSSWRAQAQSAALDRATQIQLAPHLRGIQNEIRQGRIEQAARDARRALTLAETAAGPDSQAAGDALEVLIGARTSQGSASGRDSRRMLERLSAIRNPEGPGSWERARPARDGVVVARPPKQDPVPPTTTPAQPPTEPSRDDRPKERLPLPDQKRKRMFGVTPELCESILGRHVDSALRCMDALVHEALRQGNMVRAEGYLRQAASYRRGLRFGDDLALA